MIRAIKRFLWPCKHGVKVTGAPRNGGVITHQSLRVSSTHTGNVYRCSIWCRRCQTLVVRFEGTISERLSEDVARILAEGYPTLEADRDLWN